ncbi:hypothetical protein EFR00_06125 [Rhizobium sophoriradicis]|jgi:hypothetical protein|nr:hypothetical protein CO655_19365 [Rhizobium sp. M1]PDT37860.1 hypothetical protein CO671_06915 [Rhizobium sp. M10]RSC15377.1 hypothetical protein EFR00_06125 [Rhizobium sophoriradicis]
MVHSLTAFERLPLQDVSIPIFVDDDRFVEYVTVRYGLADVTQRGIGDRDADVDTSGGVCGGSLKTCASGRRDPGAT